VTIRAAVVGASGYAGGELLRLLHAHPALAPVVATAASHAGESLLQVHPHLAELADLPLVRTSDADLSDVDIVFLALPHGQSAPVVAGLGDDVTVVVDLGADFRLADTADWQRYYGGAHAGTWVYGLPELPARRPQIAAASRVANPGCYATSVALGLAPFVARGVDDAVVVAASGTTGAGRSPTTRLLGSEVMGSMSAYQVGGTHRHIPEMQQTLSQAAGHSVRVSFTPLLAPMPRGILATCSFATDDLTTADARAVLHECYDAEPFVKVLPDDVWPQTSAVSGSNAAAIQVAVDEHAGRVIVITAIDNLGKGAAGQAIQNANLMLDLPETMGLSRHGVAP